MKLKYFYITLIFAMVVAFAGSASIVTPVSKETVWPVDKAFHQQSLERPVASITLSAIGYGP